MHWAASIRCLASCALISCGLTFAARDAAVAQAERTPPTSRPGWLPRAINISGNLTASQRATAIANLERIERILLRVPELANPEGFEIQPDFHGGARRLGPGQKEQPNTVIEYMVRLYFYLPTKASAGGGCNCITIRINPAHDLGSREIMDEQGRSIFIELKRGEPLPLATQVYEQLLRTRDRSFVFVLLTSAGELPWKTVSRAEYYNAVIFDIEGKDGAKVAELRRAFAKTPYQEWMEGAADRKQQRDNTIRTMEALKQTPAEIEQMRKRLDDTEREVTERLKASEATHRLSNDNALALSHSITDRMRAELDSMSVAQRNLPALIDGTLAEGPDATGSRIASRDAPTAWRVLTPDYDFWRIRRSPVDVRAILVNINIGGTGLAPAVQNALLRTFDKLDWTALNQLLDVPR